MIDFPKRPINFQPRTVMETFIQDKIPIKLYNSLDGYDKESILSVPKVGHQLYDFKRKYYEFQEVEYEAENSIIMQIGQMVPTKYRSSWLIYFHYFFLRSHGLSKEQIMTGGDFLNYGISWDDTERVFRELSNHPEVSQAVADVDSLRSDVWREATEILNNYKSQ